MYFLNLACCSEHFISIKHRILATFNIPVNKKNSILTVFKMKINRISLNMNINRICLILFDPLISQKW